MVNNIVKGIINNYKVKVEVLIEVCFKAITKKKSAIFIRN